MRSLPSKIAAAVAAVLLLCAATGAKPPPDIAGIYDAAPRAGKVTTCALRWTLRRDGTFLIEDGQERTEGKWRLEPAGGMEWWLVLTDRTDNGLPDCRGRSVAAGPFADGRQSFYVNSARGLVLTKIIGALPDGTPLFGIDTILDRNASAS